MIIHNQFNLASYIALMPNYLSSLMSSYSLTQNFISRNPVYSSLYCILVIAREPAVVHDILKKNKNKSLSSFFLNLQHFLFQKGFQGILPYQVRCPSSLLLQKYCICMLYYIKTTLLCLFLRNSCELFEDTGLFLFQLSSVNTESEM